MTSYIYAVGLHNQGGLNILNRFLDKENPKLVYFLDSRLDIEKKKNFHFVSSNLIKRFFHFLRLKKKLQKDDHIFFLNGLPPIIKLNCKISVAFQNANLFREFYKINFIKWLFSFDSLRYLNFVLNSKFVDNWYIFSPRAQEILNRHIKKYMNIKIINIYEEFRKIKVIEKNNNEKIIYDFIYPASYMEHKNHKILIDTLIDLSKQNIFPKVLITLDEKSLLKINFHEIVKKYKLNFYNKFEKDQKKFMNFYKVSRYLLYLSANETIGLPILEAYSYGLKTIAPNLSYSSQFIQPDFLFDLNSKSELKKVIIDCFKNKNSNNNKTKEFKYLKNSINLDEFIKKVL